MDIKALLGSNPCKILTNHNFYESLLFDEKTLPRLCVKYFHNKTAKGERHFLVPSMVCLDFASRRVLTKRISHSNKVH